MTEVLIDVLPWWLEKVYDLAGPISVELLRHYTNDVFLVKANGQKYALKIYGSDWRHDSAILFEIDLLHFLKTRGIGVASAIASRDGIILQKLRFGDKLKQVVLFEFAAGSKPKPPFSLADYESEGKALAAMHAAADEFSTRHHRPGLDLEYLFDKPLAFVESVIGRSNSIEELIEVSRWLRQRLEILISEGLDWGICHGDVTFDNFHLTDDGRTIWYDFDSGGFGWRGIDLQGWAVFDPDKALRQVALVKGYRSLRPISDRDVHSAAFLYAAQEVWGLEVELKYRVLSQGKAAVDQYLDGQVEAFRRRQRVLSD